VQLADGQLMPAGKLVTEPVPVPVSETPTWFNEEKFAVTVVSEFGVMVQGPIPTQSAELQPVNVEFGSAVAVRVTVVP